jgi:two-component sensor histidine kinase
MGVTGGGDPPVVEPKATGEAPDLTLRALQQRRRDQFLLKEMSHRVKNSLAIVASMLHLQDRTFGRGFSSGVGRRAGS